MNGAASSRSSAALLRRGPSRRARSSRRPDGSCSIRPNICSNEPAAPQPRCDPRTARHGCAEGQTA